MSACPYRKTPKRLTTRSRCADPTYHPDCRSHAGDASSGRTASPIFQGVSFRQGQGPDQGPASMGLAPDVGLRGIMLGVQRVEVLVQPMVGRDAGIDRAANRLDGPAL